MKSFENYREAAEYARGLAKELEHAVGIEKMAGYRKGEIYYSVKLIPNDPKKRQGWEMRCETIECPKATG